MILQHHALSAMIAFTKSAAYRNEVNLKSIISFKSILISNIITNPTSKKPDHGVC